VRGERKPPPTHAVVAVFADSGKACALGFYEDEFTAHAAATKNWKGRPGYREVVVVPVTAFEERP